MVFFHLFHFNPRQTARAKMTLCQVQDIFMPANINSTVY